MKRGMSDLLRNVMSIILAIIVLASMMMLVVKLYGFFNLQEKDQAYGMLDSIKSDLNSMPLNNLTELFAYSPKGLYFITLNMNKAPANVRVSEQCFNQNCICICDEECKSKVYCYIVSKPVLQNNMTIKTIIPSIINITNTLNSYDVSGIAIGMPTKK